MPPLIIAHRGWHETCPENTLEAFQQALDLGADGIECDVRLTRDERVVVLHDNTLERMGGGYRFVHELTLHQLQQIDIVHPVTRQKAKVPTLLELLDLAHDHCLINIELKNYSFFDRRLEKAVLKILQTFKAKDHYLLSSFNPVALRFLSVHAPHIERALLFYEKQSLPNRRAVFAPWTKATTLNISRVLVNQQAIDRFHKKGYKLIVWTVNDVEEARLLAQAGVYGLISDYPDQLIKEFKPHD